METNSTKVITGKVRFCYANVFEPTAMQEGGDKKYNVAVLIPKKDKATIEKINKAVENAIQAGIDKVGKNGKPVANLKMPLRDGDEARPDDAAFAGCYFVNCTSQRKPGVVDADLNPIMEKEDFYSGCYGRVSINFYAFNVSGNKGVAAGLNNLQKLEEGERLAGGSSAEEDFSDDDDMM